MTQLSKKIKDGIITPLQVLEGITETQLAKILPIPVGSGFLVGGSHLLTNYHVLPEADTVDQCVAQFRFVESLEGKSEESIDYQIDSTFFVSNPELDYALVQLKSDMFTRQAGSEFGWIQLAESKENISPGLKWIEFEGDKNQIHSATSRGKVLIEKLTSDGYIVNSDDSLIIWHPDTENDIYKKEEIKELGRLMGKGDLDNLGDFLNKDDHNCEYNKMCDGDSVVIVQHPKGRRKQIVLNNNALILNGLYHNYLRYTADTDYGSSGSPVFNNRWELIGLHHAAVPSARENPIAYSQHPSQNNVSIECHQGIRICRIIEDLKRQSVKNFKLKGFIDDFVLTQEQFNLPPLPSTLEFDGMSDYIEVTQLSENAALERSSNRVDDFSEFSIEAWVNPRSSEATNVIFSQVCTEPWYEDFGEDSIFGKYLLSLQISPEGNVVFAREPFWKVSSNNFPGNGLLYPYLPKNKGRRQHPLDVLSLEGSEQAPGSSEHASLSIKIKGSSAEETKENPTESIKALQAILYCLGFFPETSYKYDSKKYQKNYASIVNGQWNQSTSTGLDKDTEAAIRNFNKWNCSVHQRQDENLFNKAIEDFDASHLPNVAHLPFIQIKDGVITIPAKAIDIFNRRGVYLGLGTQQNTEGNGLRKYKDHCGLRVLELQHCLKSVDWNNPLLKGHQFFEHKDDLDGSVAGTIPLTGHFDWPTESGFDSINDQATQTTACSVRKLQRTFCQSGDGVFGLLALSALEKAKSYTVKTRKQLPIGEFSHIAVTVGNQEIKLYINGQLVNRRYTGNCSIGHIHRAFIGARPQRLSASNRKNPFSAYFKGAISEVRFWKMSLPPEKIAGSVYSRLSHSEVQNEDLVGYWRLEEGRLDEDWYGVSANNKQAESGREKRPYCAYNLAEESDTYSAKSELHGQDVNKGTRLRSAVSFPSVPLPFGLSISQPLTLEVPRVPLQNTLPDSDLEWGGTVEFWVKFDFGNGDIICGGNHQNDLFKLRWNNGKIDLELRREGSPTLEVETRKPVPRPEMWHHVAFSWGASHKEVNLYLDGKLQPVVAMQAQVETISYKKAYRSIVTFAANKLSSDELTAIRLVPSSAIDESPQRFQCSFADLRVWKVARPHSKIAAYARQRLDAVREAQNGLVGYWRFDGKAHFTAQSDDDAMSSGPQQATPPTLKWVMPKHQALTFTDIDSRHWATKFIAGLQRIGLGGCFCGVNETQFRPDDPMTREEFAILLLNAFGGKQKLDRASTLLQFKDEEKIDCRYLADIEYVWRLGLISGDVIEEQSTDTLPKGSSRILEITFNPQTKVSRGIAVSAIFDSLREVWDDFSTLKNDERDDACEQTLARYEDVPPALQPFCKWIPRKRVAIALQKGLIVHRTPHAKTLDLCPPEEVQSDSQSDPQSEVTPPWLATRAEVAAILYQALVIQRRVPAIDCDRILKG